MSSMVLGRYCAGESIVHRADPRIKLTLMVAFIAIVLLAATPASLAVAVLFTVLFYAASHLGVRTAWSAVAPLTPLVILTALANLFFVQGGDNLLVLGFIRITENGAYQAAFMGVRLLIMLFGACLLTLTTNPLQITDAFESMLKPFARFGLPAHELAMMAGIALRFLPQFADEFASTRAAQLSRGSHLSQGRLRERLHAFNALIVPLFASVFRHADTLANAMDARCYHGGPGRSHLYELKLTRIDVIVCLALVVMAVCIVTVNVVTGA